MNGERTKREHPVLHGGFTLHTIGRSAEGQRHEYDLELNLLLCSIEFELNAVRVSIGQSSELQEVVARPFGHALVGLQLLPMRFEIRLADDSILGSIAFGSSLKRDCSAVLLGKCQQMAEPQRRERGSTDLLVPNCISRISIFDVLRILSLIPGVAFLKAECALLCKGRHGHLGERCICTALGDSRRSKAQCS